MTKVLLLQMTPEFQNKTLASMDDRFLRAGKSLLHLSPKKVECLTAVVDSKELVQWLQSTIKCKCFASANLLNCYQQHYVQV